MLLLLLLCVQASAAAAEPSAGSAAWDTVTTFGNHRYAIPVPAGAASSVAYTAEVEWRRSGNSTAISEGLVLFCADADAGVGTGAGAGVSAGGSCSSAAPPNAGLLNATVLNSSRVSAFVAIDARSLAPGAVVHMYYMPFSRNAGSAFGEQVTYLKNTDRTASSAASVAWHRELTAAAIAVAPHLGTDASTYEPRTQFDAYTELERTATAAEIAGMLGSAAATSMGDVLVFPEPRERQIRMTWRHPQSPTLPDLPHSWAVTGPSLSIQAGAFDTGEFATFQLGLFASKAALDRVDLDLSVGATGFVSASGGAIPQSALNCFNLGGVDDRGRSFKRSYSVPHLQTGALWFGLPVPEAAAPGSYNGSIGLILTVGGKQVRHTVSVALEVTSATAYRSGDRNLTKMTRTRWVNSRIGETDVPAQRHSALVVDTVLRTVQTWSTLVTLTDSGLPKQLTRTGVSTPVTLLSGPFEFAVDGSASCEALVWDNTAAIASWTGRCTGAGEQSGVVQTISGSLDADGTMMYDIALSAAAGSPKQTATVTLTDVKLVIPMATEAVPYSMGLGRQGDRTVDWDWRWWVGQTEPSHNNWGPKPIVGTGYQNNMVWLGDVDQGMRFKLLGHGDNWLGALHTVSAAAQIPAWGGVPVPPSPTPTSVGGQVCGGNCSVYSGGVRIRKDGGSTNVTAFRGAQANLSTTGLMFKFELLLTPCVRLNTTKHFGDQGRYFQYSQAGQLPVPSSDPTVLAKEFINAGVKVVNVHQGVPVLNPFINYPFEPAATEPLTALAQKLHDAGGRMKLYYTTRELSNHVSEMWMLRALGAEVLDPGSADTHHEYANVGGGSGGASWLQEHLRSNYSVCWSTPSANIAKDGMLDSAVCDSQAKDLHQRWSNYYVAGLDWLVSEPPEMDGLYLDGIAYDRTTMKRCRKVMDAAKEKQAGSESALIDIHSGNNFSPQYGMVSPALQYMMLLPYMDSTMFGEGYQSGYDRPAGTGVSINGGGPDWWLIEVSALPFGLMNDMLGNGQRWRGWLFGCVTRLPYGGAKTNKADWAIWDRYRLTETSMVGWWAKQVPRPVQIVAPEGADDATVAACTTTPDRTGLVLATAYVLKGVHTLVSVASWANNSVSCDLLVDWTSLGLSPPTQVQAHAIDLFQDNATFSVQGDRVKNVPTAPARGWLLVLGTYIEPPPGPPPRPPAPGPAPPGPPPPPPWIPGTPFTWGNISTGAPGSGSSCASGSATSCLFNKTICKSLYGGQCGILEHEVESKCGAWPQCAGAICRPGYRGYCLARAHITGDKTNDVWGYRKVPRK